MGYKRTKSKDNKIEGSQQQKRTNVKSNKQQNNEQEEVKGISVKTSEEILLGAMEELGINMKESQSQIRLLLSCIESGSQIKIIPLVSKETSRGLVQVYDIMNDKTIIKHRTVRRRTSVKKSNSHDKPMNSNKLLFFVNPCLLLNCVVLAMSKNQKIDVMIGLANEEIMRKQLQQPLINFQKHAQIQENMNIYNKIKLYLQQIYEQNKFKLEYQQNGKRISKFFKASFPQLDQLKIGINNQLLSISEWIFGLKLMAEIFEIIEKQTMRLQKLYMNCYDHLRYGIQIPTVQIIDREMFKINASIKNILDAKSKNSTNDNATGYFPFLTQISFTPMPEMLEKLFTSSFIQQIQAKQQNEQSLDYELDLTWLHLASVPAKINEDTNLQKLLRYILPYFPKITHFVIEMAPGVYFTKFNQLCSQMHRYTSLLQSLHIQDNDPKLNKQLGLREILKNYPYLSDIKIKIWPKYEPNNRQVNPQFTMELEYIKEIQFRRIHIQRMLNMIKILEKQGYDLYQCMGICEFMKPMNFLTNRK